jgi:hypothetical protein
MASSAQHSGRFDRVLSSPRAQRRFFWLGSGVLLIGIAAFVSVFFLRGTSNAYTSPISNVPAQKVPHPVKAPPSKAALAVARKFIESAVLRKNLDVSYRLASPELREGLTLKQWRTGNIPVVYYPAGNTHTAGFTVDWSYRSQILLDVFLVVKKGHPNIRPDLDFYIGLKRKGGTAHGRWLVNYFQPNWHPGILSAQ